MVPASVGMGNLMVTTWVIGRDALSADLGEKLAAAPWDLIVLVMATAVAGGDIPPAVCFMERLAVLQTLPEEEREEAGMGLGRRATHCLSISGS